MKTKMVLVAVFVLSIAAATFMEKSHGPEAARAVVYNAKWFEVLFALIALNLLGNIIQFRLWQRKKFASFLFHFSFIVVMAGAAVTRYFGEEGILHLREGETAGEIQSAQTVLSVQIKDGSQKIHREILLLLSTVTGNRYHENIRVGSDRIQVRTMNFIPNADRAAVEDEAGQPVLMFVAACNHGAPKEIVLGNDESTTFQQARFVLGGAERSEGADVRFSLKEGRLHLQSDTAMTVLSMKDTKTQVLISGIQWRFEPLSIYTIRNVQFAYRQFYPKARIEAIPRSESDADENALDALNVSVRFRDQSWRISLFGRDGEPGREGVIRSDSLEIRMAFGSKPLPLPFRIRLDDFTVHRYPGSRMPSSYRSEVAVKDAARNITKPYSIYMNHILKYRGYRFYQASYDEDEKGSILTVSRDPGTPVVYAGYLILIASLTAAFFQKNGRFREINEILTKFKTRNAVRISLLILAGLAFCPPVSAGGSLPKDVPKEHCKKFSRLLVQDSNGRITPVYSLEFELMHALGHPEKRLNLSLEQLGWGLFFTPERFPQSTLLEDQNRDEKSIQLIGEAAGRKLLRIFPIPGDSTNRWTTDEEALHGTDSSHVKSFMARYLQSIQKRDWESADRGLEDLKLLQQRNGGRAVPSETKANLEICYFKLNIFERLHWILIIAGAIFTVLALLDPLSQKKKFKLLRRLSCALLILGFLSMTFGLGLRWVASSHAPWSNKYESMIFIAWAVMFAGVLFSRFSRIPAALAGILSGLVLLFAQSASIDPKITNLPPVLKSKWLIIHVFVIIAGYGFFAVGVMLAVFNLALLASLNQKNKMRLSLTITPLSLIHEQILMMGLLAVMIGNIFGSVWANESWGRYWGWDSKETWTLIIILVYSAILHARLIRSVHYLYWINVFSLWTFGTILMTYLGVNVYLTGMHSYAQGQAGRIPIGLPIGLAILLALSVIAFMKRKMISGEKNGLQNEGAAS